MDKTFRGGVWGDLDFIVELHENMELCVVSELIAWLTEGKVLAIGTHHSHSNYLLDAVLAIYPMDISQWFHECEGNRKRNRLRLTSFRGHQRQWFFDDEEAVGGVEQ